MRACMGTAARTTRPRRRWQRVRTPVSSEPSLQDQISGELVVKLFVIIRKIRNIIHKIESLETLGGWKYRGMTGLDTW